MNRRSFLKTSSLATVALGSGIGAVGKPVNQLPYWRGFNLLDFFSHDPEKGRINPKEHLQWMADWGFNFVRIPVSYPTYLSFDRSKPILPHEVLQFDDFRLEQIDNLIFKAHQNGLHVSLNLHRAPGFCINAGFIEPYNLWKDEEALSAFCAHWEMWATRYRGVSSEKLSFDLVNEPFAREDVNDQLSPGGLVPVDQYLKVASAALNTIKTVDPQRLVIANGNGGGGIAVPELAHLDLAQSCRGYNPMLVSHYKASWVFKNPEELPKPVWPGEIEGKMYNKEMIVRYYEPWVELIRQGVGVHCGECGAYNRTPHHVFLAWFEDVLDVLQQHRIGFGIWEFSGAFGILNSGREDIQYEDWYGQKLDRKYLNLLMKYR
jgi:endoglucanase